MGRLIEDLMFRVEFDQRYVKWVPYDGVGRSVRNGVELYRARIWAARGGGMFRSRPHSNPQLKPGEIDWARIGEEGAR